MVFPLHTVETASADATPHLATVTRRFGFLPNVYAHLAEAPVALEALLQLGTFFSRTSLTEQQRHVLLLTSSVENRCSFCVAAHTRGARYGGLSDDTITALRDGDLPDDPSDAALVTFVRTLIRARGFVSDHGLNEFFAAGFTHQHALEVVLGVTLKLLTNYVNHITHTELNAELTEYAWPGPTR